MKDDLEIKNIFDTKSLYLYFVIFFVTFLLFRIILPLGDEPDYFHRFQYYIFNFQDFLYYSHDFNQATTCNKNFLVGGLLDLYLRIAPYFCNNSFNDFFERGFIGLYLNLTYFILVFILFKSKKILKNLNIEKDFTDTNMHIFFCSIIYPSTIYYMSARSNEIFLYYFIFLFFFTWRNYKLSYLIGFLAITLDFGNGLLFFLFINYFYFFRFLNLYLSIRKIIILLLLISLFIVLFHDYLRIFLSIIFLKSNILFFENLATAVLDLDKNFQVYNFIKLIITYLSFIFLSPGFLKSILLIIIMTSLILYVFFVITGFLKNKNYENSIKNNKLFNDYFINFIACLSFVILLVLILPTHAYIRYYIFIYPFIFSIFYIIFRLRNTFLISFYAILFLSIETTLYRIMYYL